MNRKKQLVRYVLPAVLSNVSIFLFTIVDGICVGQGIGTDALGAVNIAFPYVMIFTAVCLLTTVGGLTITAIRFGRNDSDGAGRVFLHSFRATLILCILLSAIGVFLTGPLARLLGANDTFYDMTCEYLFWYSVFVIPCGMCTMMQGFVRNDGSPVLVSSATIIATAANIFGDWLLIFPLHMGLKGAAIATGASQTLALLITLSHFARKRGQLRFARLQPEKGLLPKILLRGLPECIAQFCVPVSTILTNRVIIRQLGDEALNAFSVICYAACFSAAAFAGTAEGLQPLLGNCYGAWNESDLRYYFRSGLIIGFFGSAAITGILYALWGMICTLFGASGPTREIAMAAMPRYSWGFSVQALNVIISAYLYSTTRTAQALTISVLRSFVVSSLVILGLPAIFGSGIIWYTFGIYEGVVLAAAAVLLWRADRSGAIGSTLE